MSIMEHAVWWQVYPLGATGAPIREVTESGVHHRLRRLEAWLDYVVELGCNGLLLGPIFTSTSHGYDTLDHLQIDPRLGDDADFDRLMSACRRRGLLVLLDGVFNHVGVNHRLVTESTPGDPGSAIAWAESDGAVRPRPWEGNGVLAELNHDNPATADFVINVMLHWLRRGIAGWRLDVAYAVPPDFWRRVVPRVRAEFPDAVFLGEVIHGDYVGIAEAGGLDSVTQYELWKATWSSIHDANFWELAWTLERHAEFSRRMLLNTFIGNHDVDRIASLAGDAGAALGAVVLFTVPGMPSVYYGDEQGFRGMRGEGFAADDPIRPPLPETPAGLLPDGEWLHRHYQALIGLRRRNPWLTRGNLAVLDKQNESITYAVRGSGHEAVVALDLRDPRASVRIDGDEQYLWPG